MNVIILAAGYATRLEPLTLKTSKSLLPVGNRLIIDRILEKISAVSGIASIIYIITNAKFFENFKDWLKSSKYQKSVSLINDGTTSNETRLGAIKDMAMVIRDKKIDDDLLVVAGDNLFDFELGDFLRFAREKKDGVSIALHDIGTKDAAKNFGVVKIDGHNRVVDFSEKPQAPESTLISTGIYYFPKAKVLSVEKYVAMQSKMDAPGYYIGWLSRADNVYGFAFSEDWYDIGTIESYKKADREYLKKDYKDSQ